MDKVEIITKRPLAHALGLFVINSEAYYAAGSSEGAGATSASGATSTAGASASGAVSTVTSASCGMISSFIVS